MNHINVRDAKLQEAIDFLEALLECTPEEAHDLLINNGEEVLNRLKGKEVSDD